MSEPSAPRAIAHPSQVIVPLAARQMEQAPAIIAPGTRVMRGQPLITAMIQRSHVPLSPVCGLVAGTTTAQLTNGHVVPAVQIDVDAHAEQKALLEAPPKALDLPAWIDYLRDAGIWADRLTCPDLLGQLHHAITRPCDVLACNLLDADPDIHLNEPILDLQTARLLAGVETIARTSKASRIVLVIDADYPASLGRKVESACRERDFELLPVQNRYPIADPTMLLHGLLKRRLRPGRLPTEQGVIILDAVAAAAIGSAALHQQPMIEVLLAIRDARAQRVDYITAPIGTSLSHIFRQLDIEDPAACYAGDVLRDIQLSPQAVVGGSELIVHAWHLRAVYNPDSCIRCGWCVDACPTRIHPAGLLEAAQQADRRLADRFGLHACIECGLCSYVCPSRLPLLNSIRQLRRELSARGEVAWT